MEGQIKFILAEDEAMIALGIKLQLEEVGYLVSGIFATGEAVLERLEKEKPDLILMDIRLAGSLDGFETARILRNFSSIPVIFLSGYEEGDLKQGR